MYRYNSNLTVNNSILWGNSESNANPSNQICSGKIGSANFAVNSSNIGSTYSNYSINYSDIGNWSGGTGNINADPKFVSTTDYHLQSGSPATNMGAYPVPVSTPTPTSTPIPTPEPTPSPTGSVSYDFSRNLYFGLKGPDVKQLQALLVNEVNYPANLLTGYFGSITQNAVKRLQEKYGIKPISGYFGSITRKALNALIWD